MSGKLSTYLSYTAQSRGITSYTSNKVWIDAVLPSWWKPQADGTVVLQEPPTTVEDTSFITTLATNGDESWGVIANYSGSGTWSWTNVHTILNNSTIMANHVTALVNLAVTKGYVGIDIDYEQGTDALDRNPFTTFCTNLASALHAVGKQLSITVQPKLSEPGPQVRHQIQDWAALGAVCDEFHIMLYDYDPAAGPASQSPFPWWQDIAKFGTSLVSRTKIMLGGPTYGYHWNNTTLITDLEYDDCDALRITNGATWQYNATDRSPYFTYSTHTVYAENTQSLTERARFIRWRGLKGMFVWRLAGEDDGVYLGMKTAMEHGTNVEFREATSTIVAVDTTTLNAVKPPTTAQGDFIIAYVTVRDDIANITMTPPEGWTQCIPEFMSSAGQITSQAWYKFAGSSEPSTYAWGISSNQEAGAILASYRNVDVNTPIASYSSLGSGTTDPQSTASVSTTETDQVGVFFRAIKDNAASQTSQATNFLERIDANAGDGSTYWMYLTMSDSNGSLGSVGSFSETFDFSGSPQGSTLGAIVLNSGETSGGGSGGSDAPIGPTAPGTDSFNRTNETSLSVGSSGMTWSSF